MRVHLTKLLAGSIAALLLHCGHIYAQDQGDFIRRMDANGNGMIDPEESQGRARGMLERMAQGNSRINLSRPIPVEMLTREMDRMRSGFSGNSGGRGGGRGEQGGGQSGGFSGGFFGGGQNGGGQNEGERGGGRNRRQRDVDAAGNPVPTLLEGFGNEYNDTPVLGFGADQEANLTGIKTTDEDETRMERTLRQNDRNGDGVIEGEEIENGRWDDGNPKQYDANRDGRLTKNELLIRAAQKRVAEEAAEKAEREQRNREREQRGSDRGGDRGGERGGGRFGGMFGGGMGGEGFPGGGGFGGRGFGGGGGFGGNDWQGRGGGFPGMGGEGGMNRFGGGPPGGMRFSMQAGDPSALGGGPPGGMTMTMGAPGGDGGRGGGRGDRGNGGGENGEQGRGGPPGFGGGEEFGGRGGRGRGFGGGDDNGDPAARIEGIFKELDKNNSGSLEQEEWDGLRTMRGEDLDKDKSGSISKQEFMEVVGERSGLKIDPSKYAWRPSGPLTYRAREMRDKYPEVPAWFWNEDKDGDGQIMMSERSTNWTDDRLARWMKEDTNGDGMISMAEAVASAKPAAKGLVTISPKTSNANGDPNNAVASANVAGESQQSEQRGESSRSRNSENNSQTGPRIDAEEARKMKAERDWSRVGNGGRDSGSSPSAGPAPSGELPADLPKDIDKKFAEKSANFFSQKLDVDPKDGVLSGKEMEDFKDADTNKDGKVSLTEYIIFKKG